MDWNILLSNTTSDSQTLPLFISLAHTILRKTLVHAEQHPTTEQLFDRVKSMLRSCERYCPAVVSTTALKDGDVYFLARGDIHEGLLRGHPSIVLTCIDGMVNSCCIFKRKKHRAHDKGVYHFSIPSVIELQGLKLSLKRHQVWCFKKAWNKFGR